MKAYQMKIVIKDSHPPIWRRFIVPAGLSFSQLGIVLNEVMGWTGYHMNSFEFGHLGIKLEEESEDYGWEDYDTENSAENMIEPYLDSEEWFTYVYDFGDYWQHKVTVEKVLTDYKYDYPMVLKFKGDTPYEDCGGIDGYYNLLEILKDPSHPRYQDMKEWTEDQISGKYDLNTVNDNLEALCLSSRKSEPMTQWQIYEELFAGKPFKQIQGKTEIASGNANAPVGFFSGIPGETPDDIFDGEEDFWNGMDDMLEALSKEMAQMQRQAMDKAPEEMCISDILSEHTKDNLVNIAKNHFLSGYRKFKKAELVKFLNQKLLDGDVMRRFFTYLEDEEIEILDKGYKKAGGYIVEWPCEPEYLFAGGYCMPFYDGTCLITSDVWEAYRINCKGSWKEEREEILGILDHMNAAAMLYGYCELETLLQLYERNTGISKTPLDIYRIYPNFPENKKEFVLRDDRLILKEADDSQVIENLEHLRRNLTFYMPSSGEIRSLSRKSCLPYDLHMEKFNSFLLNILEFDDEEAWELCFSIQHIFRVGGTPQDALDCLEEYVDLNKKEMKKIKLILEEVWLHTRCILLCGHTPAEVQEKTKPINTASAKRKSKKKGKIIDFSDRKPSGD
ncbi:MAG: plasmid pRiA4b ORF-3 family protein [Eubacteriales bacterium]|nr:plasmid pRiA4b ORF-3 family protein [Eubacteriales bacterium]